ncbi:hypothetical protein GH714_037848 [Hevea brasiliensis]|uniref:LOB domain-containing protein n=1 Tax=Hevea brasiliensis TaxID=3981 RepID=A0A6A6L752_HEVBR|nr:hypothetical protein GH714_037848 [Hevea brasiliensis]
MPHLKWKKTHAGSSWNPKYNYSLCCLQALEKKVCTRMPFSPYFSPHEPQKFASVHKVFGASNVSKMLMEVPESQRADAANSLVYEANVRLKIQFMGAWVQFRLYNNKFNLCKLNLMQ